MAESFANFLECSICFEKMVEPKILPCGHTFCLDCLCKIEPEEKKIKCPDCRKEHDLPLEGAKGFNKNYKLATLIDNFPRLATLIDDVPPVPSAPPLDQHEGTLIDDLPPVPSAPPLDQLVGKIPDRTLQPVLAKQFLITGGGWTDDGNDLATEVIDVQSNSNVTSSFGDLPSERRGAVGGLLGSTPILCGGSDYYHNSDYQDSCFTLKDSQWRQTHKMTTKRSFSASVQINASTLWILGGSNYGDGYIDSSEFVELDSAVGKPGPKLPYAVAGHCAVKYKNKVYVIGGKDGPYSYVNKVLIFNPMNDFTHIEGPSLITKREVHACGLMTNGQQSKIVVAGGYNGIGNGLSSVEIFDPTVNNWIPGPPLPYRLTSSAMATSPDGGGVILFGGWNVDKWATEDTILELRYGSDKWTTLPQKLKQPRTKHVVIPIN